MDVCSSYKYGSDTGLETLSCQSKIISIRSEVNFPSADWLSYPRAQLTVFVGSFVCKASKFFQHCFLKTIFSTGDTLKSYKSKGICAIALKFGQ